MVEEELKCSSVPDWCRCSTVDLLNVRRGETVRYVTYQTVNYVYSYEHQIVVWILGRACQARHFRHSADTLLLARVILGAL